MAFIRGVYGGPPQGPRPEGAIGRGGGEGGMEVRREPRRGGQEKGGEGRGISRGGNSNTEGWYGGPVSMCMCLLG